MERHFDQVQRHQVVNAVARRCFGWLGGVCFLALVVSSFEARALDDPAERRPVNVGVYVVEIEEKQQAVVADFVVVASWQQDELADPTATDLRNLPLEEVDTPRLFIINGRSLRKKFDEIAEIHPSGRVVYRQRYQGTLSIPMDLRNFPRDAQKVAFHVGTLDHRDRVLVPARRRSGAMKKFTVGGWNFDPIDLGSSKQVAPDGVHTFATVTADYEATRNGMFFAWKLFIPLGLIVLMAYAVFWLDPTLIGAQIGLATSTVFTLIAYNFALSQILPPVSYLTRADHYLVGCMLLVFGALGEAVVTGALARYDQHVALARRIDMIARFVYPVLFAIIAIVAFS